MVLLFIGPFPWPHRLLSSHQVCFSLSPCATLLPRPRFADASMSSSVADRSFRHATSELHNLSVTIISFVQLSPLFGYLEASREGCNFWASKVLVFHARCIMPIMPIMTKMADQCPHPRFGSGTNFFAVLIFAAVFSFTSVSGQPSVQYVTSVKGYPTSGGLVVTVYGSGFGSSSAAVSVKIGSTVCDTPAIVLSHQRVSCKLGKFIPH